jgi:hypothetical protein
MGITSCLSAMHVHVRVQLRLRVVLEDRQTHDAQSHLCCLQEWLSQPVPEVLVTLPIMFNIEVQCRLLVVPRSAARHAILPALLAGRA